MSATIVLARVGGRSSVMLKQWERRNNFVTKQAGSVVEWLKCCDCNRHGLGSKPTCAILFCPWERHFAALSPAWRSWQAVLNFSHISIKLKIQNKKLAPDSRILASPETGRGNCLPYAVAPLAESGG